MIHRVFRRASLLATIFAYVVAASGPARSAPPLTVERVVLLMRHGVRPPTKSPAMPAGIAADRWPEWNSPPGNLTAHGAAAIRLLGAADRDRFARAGLLPRRSCPAPWLVQVHSDSDQRTIGTGDAWLAGLAPGCALTNRHRAQDEVDPLFLNAGENGEPFAPARADRAIAAALRPQGIAGAEASYRPLLARLDRILCGQAQTGCGIGARPTRLVGATADKRPKLAGALDLGSTAAQILLLEYAEGLPLQAVGWGRATAADVTALSALHAVEFAILARPPYIAAANVAPIARLMRDALADGRASAPRIIALMGHDTNVASLGGLLGLHWQAPGFARDDPPPGGAILIELLKAPGGARFVRASFRAQALDQIRRLAPAAPYRATVAIEGCATPCPLARFQALLAKRLTP